MFRKRSEHHAGRIKFGFCDRFRENGASALEHTSVLFPTIGEKPRVVTRGEKGPGSESSPANQNRAKGDSRKKSLRAFSEPGASCQKNPPRFRENVKSVRVTSREFPHPDFRLRAIFLEDRDAAERGMRHRVSKTVA